VDTYIHKGNKLITAPLFFGKKILTTNPGTTLTTLLTCLLACSFFSGGVQAAAADARLPDGSDFVFWEQPLSFSKTYYVDGNSTKSNDHNPGTSQRPFRTIGKAAEVLQPGERVIIAAGIYRECVRPARGGSGPDKMISYEAAPGATVFVRGSEVLRDGWETSPLPANPFGPVSAMNDSANQNVFIWKHELTGALFPDAYNPFALANVPGDWSWLDTAKVDMGPYFRRRGMVFADGKPLEPVEQYRELVNPPMQRARSGLPSRNRGGSIMQEIGGSADRKFWVEHSGTEISIRLPNQELGKSTIEITTREQAFAPRVTGLGYIRIKGITFQHAGNAFPPPQHGLVSTSGGHHWIIEGNTIEWANGMGLDIGMQHWSGRPVPMAGASHVIRGNTIRYIGVEGLGGMGTQNTLVEDNLIEWVGWQDAERAWEAAGVKFHFARNMLFRRNVVRHIRHANAIWLDSGNSNNRITGNVFADVVTVSAAIHMEMNVANNQIDDNIIWDVRNAEPGTPGQRGAGGSGIFLHASDRQTVAHNLIGRCDNVGVFPLFRADRAGSGTGIEHKIYNNIIARCDKGGIVFIREQNEADGNVYAGLPERFQGFFVSDPPQWLDLASWRAHGWDRQGRTENLEINFDADRLELTMGGQAGLQKLPVFNRIESDLLGQSAEGTRFPGPFNDPGDSQARPADPRRYHPAP